MSAPAPLPPLPMHNCYWVLPGQVLAGEHPGGPTPGRTKQRLERLFAAGIEAFLDLTDPDEVEPYDKALPFNISYRRCAIQDHGLPSRRVQMLQILDSVEDCLSAGRPLYVHCRAGIGRTGLVMGCLLVERGLTGEEALRELNRLWQQCRRSKGWPYVPETDEQVAYVRTWKSREAKKPARTPRPSTASTSARVARTRASDMPASARAARARASEVPATAPAAASRPSSARASGAASRASVTPTGVPAAPPRASGTPVREAPASQRPSSAPPRRPAAPAAPPAALTIPSTPPSTAPPSKPMHRPKAAHAQIDPLLEPETLSAARELRERFVGTLVGLAVGDAVAAGTQYRRPGTFTPVGDMLGGGPFDLPRGAWSDDTSMALCLAESLLESSGFDAKDQVDRYTRWQQDGYLSPVGHCVGITASTARALAMSKWRRQVFAGSHDPKLLDPEPLSRVGAAVLFFFSSLEAAVQNAGDQARTTCQAPPVLDDCRTLGRALHAALSGQPKASIVAGIGFPSAAVSQKTATSNEVLQAACWAFASTDSFRDAVLRAANLGGNSDVAASVCGQLAGAHYGVAAIPASWRNSLMQQDLIESFGDRLLTQALLSLSS